MIYRLRCCVLLCIIPSKKEHTIPFFSTTREISYSKKYTWNQMTNQSWAFLSKMSRFQLFPSRNVSKDVHMYTHLDAEAGVINYNAGQHTIRAFFHPLFWKGKHIFLTDSLPRSRVIIRFICQKMLVYQQSAGRTFIYLSLSLSLFLPRFISFYETCYSLPLKFNF